MFAKVQKELKSHNTGSRETPDPQPGALPKKKEKKKIKELRGEGSEVRGQSHDLTKGSRGRYWRLVTVKVAPSSSSSQTDAGAWRSGENKSVPQPLQGPAIAPQALLLPL